MDRGINETRTDWGERREHSPMDSFGNPSGKTRQTALASWARSLRKEQLALLFTLYQLVDTPIDTRTLGSILAQHPNNVGRCLRRFRAEGLVRVSYCGALTLYQLTAFAISILNTLHGVTEHERRESA